LAHTDLQQVIRNDQEKDDNRQARHGGGFHDDPAILIDLDDSEPDQTKESERSNDPEVVYEIQVIVVRACPDVPVRRRAVPKQECRRVVDYAAKLIKPGIKPDPDILHLVIRELRRGLPSIH
jgi:hypothetical protein